MKKQTQKPPKKLSKDAKKLWQLIVNEYFFETSRDYAILQTACEAYTRMQTAQRLIDRHGICVTDRFGQLRSNPASAVERDSRSQFLQAMKQLNLQDEVEQLKSPRFHRLPQREQ